MSRSSGEPDDMRCRTRLRAEILVRGLGSLPAFRDRPYHQRLPSARVARREDARHRGLVILRSDVAAWIKLEAGFFDQAGLDGSGETHREQDKFRVQREFGAMQWCKLGSGAHAYSV